MSSSGRRARLHVDRVRCTVGGRYFAAHTEMPFGSSGADEGRARRRTAAALQRRLRRVQVHVLALHARRERDVDGDRHPEHGALHRGGDRAVAELSAPSPGPASSGARFFRAAWLMVSEPVACCDGPGSVRPAGRAPGSSRSPRALSIFRSSEVSSTSSNEPCRYCWIAEPPPIFECTVPVTPCGRLCCDLWSICPSA